MLPSAGVYYFPWEINSSVPEGKALRTFGRLCCYDLARSEAVLIAQHSSAQYQVCVDTKFVEPFQAQLGSRYMVLGEAEHREAARFFAWGLDLGWAVRLGSKSQVSSCPHLATSVRIRAIETLSGMRNATLHMVLSEGPVVKARILTCVEGMNVPLLEQAIQEQRKYFSERQEKKLGKSTS